MTGCREGRLHVDMEFGIVEVEVEEETDDYVRGPLLVTGFANDATPFLRYRIGDVGTRSKRAVPLRPARRRLPRRRRPDRGLRRDARRPLDRPPRPHLQGAARRRRGADPAGRERRAIEVRIVPPAELATPAPSRSSLKEIRSRLGDEIRIELVRVDAIPREANGKFRAVKSKSVAHRGASDDPRRARPHAGRATRASRAPWGPGKPYPELERLLGDGPADGPPNQVYAAVRAALSASASTRSASAPPTGIRSARSSRAGKRIVLKPNFIRHWNPAADGRGGTVASVITHGAILRAVADYAFLAAGAEGAVAIAEAPQQDCDFERDPRGSSGSTRSSRFYDEVARPRARGDRPAPRGRRLSRRHHRRSQDAARRSRRLPRRRSRRRRASSPARASIRTASAAPTTIPDRPPRSTAGRPQRLSALRDRALGRPRGEPPEAQDPQEDRASRSRSRTSSASTATRTGCRTTALGSVGEGGDEFPGEPR